mmetsp:Transcript_124799/g.186436  ORF Transcript_124799/g.186436 Transcript_124799/m.186436 type:complete len:99 (-) Transcript_124799:892-1188(-)
MKSIGQIGQLCPRFGIVVLHRPDFVTPFFVVIVAFVAFVAAFVVAVIVVIIIIIINDDDDDLIRLPILDEKQILFQRQCVKELTIFVVKGSHDEFFDT